MYSLGIDTSNYTTSVALVDENNAIIEDRRVYLKVDDRATGLRQSEALFQHWNNLPQLLTPLLEEYGTDIGTVTVSARPRPQNGSYMPVFGAGVSAGKIAAAALGAKYFEATHQEGHFKAAALESGFDFRGNVLCAHLSGGTLELVNIREGKYEIVGGTKDISYGKLIDRIGVAMGYPFPCGAKLDELACGYTPEGRKNPFCRVFTDRAYTNVSGLETQLIQAVGTLPDEELAFMLMDRLAESFLRITEQAKDETGAVKVLVSGGVASSRFLRKRCEEREHYFGTPRLCTDNAVGVAVLKGTKLWD